MDARWGPFQDCTVKDWRRQGSTAQLHCQIKQTLPRISVVQMSFLSLVPLRLKMYTSDLGTENLHSMYEACDDDTIQSKTLSPVTRLSFDYRK